MKKLICLFIIVAGIFLNSNSSYAAFFPKNLIQPYPYNYNENNENNILKKVGEHEFEFVAFEAHQPEPGFNRDNSVAVRFCRIKYDNTIYQKNPDEAGTDYLPRSIDAITFYFDCEGTPFDIVSKSFYTGFDWKLERTEDSQIDVVKAYHGLKQWQQQVLYRVTGYLNRLPDTPIVDYFPSDHDLAKQFVSLQASALFLAGSLYLSGGASICNTVIGTMWSADAKGISTYIVDSFDKEFNLGLDKYRYGNGLILNSKVDASSDSMGREIWENLVRPSQPSGLKTL